MRPPPSEHASPVPVASCPIPHSGITHLLLLKRLEGLSPHTSSLVACLLLGRPTGSHLLAALPTNTIGRDAPEIETPATQVHPVPRIPLTERTATKVRLGHSPPFPLGFDPVACFLQRPRQPFGTSQPTGTSRARPSCIYNYYNPSIMHILLLYDETRPRNHPTDNKSSYYTSQSAPPVVILCSRVRSTLRKMLASGQPSPCQH